MLARTTSFLTFLAFWALELNTYTHSSSGFNKGAAVLLIIISFHPFFVLSCKECRFRLVQNFTLFTLYSLSYIT